MNMVFLYQILPCNTILVSPYPSAGNTGIIQIRNLIMSNHIFISVHQQNSASCIISSSTSDYAVIFNSIAKRVFFSFTAKGSSSHYNTACSNFAENIIVDSYVS